MVAASGQGQKLVPILRRDSRIIQGCRLSLLHIFLEPFRVTQIGILVIAEHIFLVHVVHFGIKSGYDLVCAPLIEGIKANHRMFLVKILFGVGKEGSKHGACVHVMTVDQIIPAILRTISIQKGNAAGRFASIKSPAQVVFRVIRGVHDRVVQLGVCYLHPPKQVMVYLIQCSISRQHGRRCPLLGIVIHREFWGVGRFCCGNPFLQFRKCRFLCPALDKIGTDHISG